MSTTSGIGSNEANVAFNDVMSGTGLFIIAAVLILVLAGCCCCIIVFFAYRVGAKHHAENTTDALSVEMRIDKDSNNVLPKDVPGKSSTPKGIHDAEAEGVGAVTGDPYAAAALPQNGPGSYIYDEEEDIVIPKTDTIDGVFGKPPDGVGRSRTTAGSVVETLEKANYIPRDEFEQKIEENVFNKTTQSGPGRSDSSIYNDDAVVRSSTDASDAMYGRTRKQTEGR